MGSDIEEIKSRLNIVDVLSEYIKLDKAGASYRATCPFHNEKTPSFMVSAEKQIWHCFGCQKGGDIFAFVMEMEGMDFRETLKQLADKAGVKLQKFDTRRSEEKNRTIEILELATKWYEYQLWSGPGQKKILDYLKGRGLTDGILKEFRLGYAPDGWRNILTFLTKRGYKTEEIARTGLLVEKTGEGGSLARYYDRFRQRIMFPIADYAGKIIGYSARVIPGADESQAKYVNTPETEVYHKSRVLYGLDKAKGEIKRSDFALLVEGNMDVIASHMAGLKNAIAISGTALTAEQLSLIRRYTRNIRMFFDMDAAGENATKKSVQLCFKQDISVQIVSLPKGKDAAETVQDDPANLVKAVRESTPVMEYYFRKAFSRYDKNKVEDKKKISQELLELIGSLDNDIEKSHWIKVLSERMGVDESALTNMLKKISLKSKIEDQPEDSQRRSLSPRTKSEVLLEELIGLMLVSSQVWEEAVKKAGSGAVFPEDSLLNLMLEKGERLKYNFDDLIKFFGNDRPSIDRAEKIYFEKRYRLDLNNNLEEIDFGDGLKQLDICLNEILKDEKRMALAHIAADLKIAENRKDQNAIIFLREEFNKISGELARLIK